MIAELNELCRKEIETKAIAAERQLKVIDALSSSANIELLLKYSEIKQKLLASLNTLTTDLKVLED